MTDRERLVKLLCEAECKGEENQFTCPERRHGQCRSIKKLEMCQVNNLADTILSDGWIRPPCNVGDTVYFVNTFFSNDPRINECEVDSLHITSGKNRIGHKKPSYALVRDINMHSLSSRIYFEKFGITAFLTREEAEQALAERQDTQCEQ